ncbi:hypothetical protein ACFXJM_37760 [Streptomyces massasporeus]
MRHDIARNELPDVRTAILTRRRAAWRAQVSGAEGVRRRGAVPVVDAVRQG